MQDAVGGMSKLHRRSFVCVAVSSALLRAGPAWSNEVVSWPALIPPGWSPRAAMDRLGIDNIEDGDPRSAEALRKLREDWDNAPPNPAVDGRRLRLWGYMVPLEQSASHIRDFLLVPYFGACLHAPAPPSNQIVHVMPATPFPKALRGTSAMWISGTLRIVRAESDVGASSYRMAAAEVEPYKA